MDTRSSSLYSDWRKILHDDSDLPSVVKEGFPADICIFDPEMINDLSSFEDPMMHPIGIPHVLVNGHLVVENSECTGVMSGEGIQAV